jgi:hypothetical protein
VRDLLAAQVDLRTDGIDYVPADELPSNHRYFRYQEQINAGGVPSEEVVRQNREKGNEYRDQTDGEHPVVDLREQAHAGER